MGCHLSDVELLKWEKVKTLQSVKLSSDWALLFFCITFFRLFLRACDLVCAVPVCALSQVRLFAPPWTVAQQAPPSREFFRQEYWSGLPFPTPGDLPDPGIEPASLAFPALAGGLFTSTPPRKPSWLLGTTKAASSCNIQQDVLSEYWLRWSFFLDCFFNLFSFHSTGCILWVQAA